MLATLTNIRWQDFLDIAIIALIIYRVLLFFVGTRAVQLVHGLALIIVIGIFARVLELRTMTWLLGRLLGFVIFLIPVVFQPELRRLLEELGRGRLLSRSARRDERAEARAQGLFKAVQYFEQHKVGALLVFQRQTGLKEHFRSSVQLHSEITSEVLISIFWPRTPLHDGAVVLDSTKLLAASVYLPLSDNAGISSWYGTRHRAAVGITEVSDAEVLVVSEESGRTSLAIGGKLTPPLSKEQLAKFLARYFVVPLDVLLTSYDDKMTSVQAQGEEPAHSTQNAHNSQNEERATAGLRARED